MAKKETQFAVLDQFLPANTCEQLLPYFRDYTIYLTLTHERKSVHGDYRTPTRDQPAHRISVNATLNPYNFLITLLHELAHLTTFVHFGSKAQPHGREWKTQFRHALIPFMGKRIFPADVERALYAYLHDPAASTCTDSRLYKALHRYNKPRPGWKLVDDIAIEQHFETDDGRRFQKIETLRTRARCRELKTGRMYYFQGIAEVKVV